MHERQKLDEARFFLRQMQATAQNAHALHPLTWQLSAFLSSARSVLQYALDEAKTKPGGRAWYDAAVAGNPVIRFFKDKRDINIHEQPVVPSRRVEVSLSDTIHVEDSVSVVVRDRAGNVVQTYSSDEKRPGETPPADEPGDGTTTRTVFLFADWTGAEDVPSLSEAYFVAVERLVQAGVAAAHITG
jgi:hypothetical protein